MILEKKNLIVNKKRGLIDKALFSRIEKVKNTILGKGFYLSINFIGRKEAQELNKKYRQKDYVPNILSFPLSNKEGEIFICLSVAKGEARNFSLSFDNFLSLLFIHGCLHLRGLDHSDEMDKLEEKYLRKFMLK
jgi:probable rRNA maturation factor